MKIDYDKTADALYLTIRKGVVKKTTRLSDLVNVDLDKSGKVLGVEVLNASLKIPKLDKRGMIPVSIS